MERICKNCDELLYAHKTYCSNCGAKWIEKRITMRNVGADFADLYLGFDTRFVRTFLDLFKKPEAVINGYITGRRMGHIDAVRYLLIALFMSGLYIFTMKSMNMDFTDFQNNMVGTGNLNQDTKTADLQKKVNDAIMNFFTNYQAVVLFGTIPLLALIGRVTFWGKSYYNFTEQAVFQMYTYSHSMIVSTPVSITCMLIAPQSILYMSLVTYPLLIGYNAYAYKRCFRLTVSETILKTLMFLVVAIITFLLIMVIAVAIGVLFAILIK